MTYPDALHAASHRARDTALPICISRPVSAGADAWEVYTFTELAEAIERVGGRWKDGGVIWPDRLPEDLEGADFAGLARSRTGGEEGRERG